MNKTKAINLRKLICMSALVLGTCMIALSVRAELRCDCSQIIEICSATVGFDANKVSIKSDSQACSRVDYLIDGQPFAALVVDGEAGFTWQGQPQTAPQIIVESCRVCADNQQNNAPATTSTADEPANAAADDDSLRPIVKIMPNYPRTAWGEGIQGRVSVEYDVSDTGVVQNIKVIASSHPVFINTTIDAISRFRFTPHATKGLKEEFYFKLVGGSEPTVTSNPL